MKEWMFVHKIGKLYAKYSKIGCQSEKVSFLAENFGVRGILIFKLVRGGKNE